MIFLGSTFKIRPWSFGDETALVKNANNKKIWDNLRDQFPHPYTLDDAQFWLNLQSKQNPTVNFAIEIDGLSVGGIGLIPGKDEARISAEIGYWLGEDYWGKGIIPEAVQFIVRYGFEELEFKRIFATVFGFNNNSMRVLEKAGFKKEAIFRDAIIKNDTIFDSHYFAIYPEQISR